MTEMDTDIDFMQIVPRLGSRSDAFEELCCQLARRATGEPMQRLHGAGGDGGIECYLDTPGGRLGWQAKYVFRVDNLMELIRIRGHLTLWGGGIHHAEIKTGVRAGVPAPDG